MRKIYTNGNIYTVTNGNAEAFVEEEGKFIYVGNNEDALSYKQEDSEIIDLQNKFVTAGFNDSHMHVVEFGDYLEIMHMGDFTGSLKELKDGIRKFISEKDFKENEWARGRGWNNDYFTEYSKVSDAGSYVKGSIYEFIESSEKVVIVVDCENSDPYKLCATLRNLDRQYTKKNSSIILFDDVHAASAWRILESFTAIPVEHMMIERVKQNKSLVDVMLISRTCQEHYKNNVDSFILVSSDSDYWGLISSLQDARFLVMIERESCGPDLKNALSDAGIFYCYIDDFYSGNTEDIKQGALFKEMYRYIDNALRLNIFEMFDEAIRTTRIEMSSAEKQQFISQYVKTMQMRITDSGDVVLEFKRK